MVADREDTVVPMVAQMVGGTVAILADPEDTVVPMVAQMVVGTAAILADPEDMEASAATATEPSYLSDFVN